MNPIDLTKLPLPDGHISFDDAKKSVTAMNLINGFMFDSVTENEEDARIVAKVILQRVIGKELSDIEVKTQKVFNGLDTKYHGIRMDAHIRPSKDPDKLVATVYDLEMEDRESDRQSLPRRQRYYSALSDAKSLETNADYRSLPEYISITILSYDPFLIGDMYYEARMSLVSHRDASDKYDDGIVNIFLYADGRINTIDAEYGNRLKLMLKYIVSGEKPDPLDSDIECIDKIVTKVKSNTEVTKEYMQRWDRELTLQREAAEAATAAANKAAGLEVIRFGREDHIPDSKIRMRLETRLNLTSDVIDELFKIADGEP